MAKAPHLEFERHIVEIQDQIEILLDTATGKGLDVTDELRVLRKKLEVLREETYRNLSPIEQVQVARHPQRPYTLDYLRLIFTDWTELHGDRLFILYGLRTALATERGFGDGGDEEAEPMSVTACRLVEP